jgi:hypothetical protein
MQLTFLILAQNFLEQTSFWSYQKCYNPFLILLIILTQSKKLKGFEGIITFKIYF